MLAQRERRLSAAREAEARRFFTNLSAATGGMTIVEGDVGVGKTSFGEAKGHLCGRGRPFRGAHY